MLEYNVSKLFQNVSLYSLQKSIIHFASMIVHHYLTFYERVSQFYLNKFTLILGIAAVKLYLFKQALTAAVSFTTQQFTCDDAASEQFLKSLSKLVNDLIEQSLALLKWNYLIIIKLMITIVKNLLIFYVEIFLGTYTCLLNAAIAGTTNFALDSSEAVIKVVNSTVVGISHEIEDGLDGISTVLNTLALAAKGIKDFFTGAKPTTEGEPYKQKISLSIKALQNISIPLSVLEKIDKFRDEDLPDFDKLQNTTQNLIALPFDLASLQLLKSVFNHTSDKLVFANILLPTMKPIESVCKTVDELGQFSKKIEKGINRLFYFTLVGILVLWVVILAVIIASEYFKWRSENQLVDELLEKNDNPLVAIFNILNKYQNRLIFYMDKFSWTRSTHFKWIISYITSQYAKTVLMIALTGVLICLVQYFLLSQVMKQMGNLPPTDEAKNAVKKLIKEVAGSYLNDTNSYLKVQQATLNDELFGHIKNCSTSFMGTINEFMMNVNNSINAVFGNTPFSKPINTVVYCTLGRKLESIEKGLGWINRNLEINIPTIDSNLENNLVNVTEILDNLRNLVLKGTNTILDTYEKSIFVELIISFAILGLWIIQLLIAIVVVIVRKLLCGDARLKVFGKSIGYPCQLSADEKDSYFYPHTDPYKLDNPRVLKELPDDAFSCRSRIEKPSNDINSSSSVYSNSQGFPTRSTSMRQNGKLFN